MVIAIIIVLALAIAGVVVFVVLKGKKASTPTIVIQPDTVYMGAKGWTISYSPGMPKNPTQDGVSWYFDFPTSDGVHYVMVPYHANKAHTILTITYRLTALMGTPQFVSVDGGGVAAFFPILERKGDQLLATQEFFRLWSTGTKLVADAQVHTVQFPLLWDKWTGVFGKTDQIEFGTTLRDLMGVGITFGQLNGTAGHGVYVTGGKARFELINYAIT